LKVILVKTEQIDGEILKEDVYYQLIDGKFKPNLFGI